MEQVIPQVLEPVQYSSVKRRWVAMFVDGLVTGGLNLGVETILGTTIAVRVLNIIMVFLYYVIMTGIWGQTLGKKWLRIKVQTMDGQVPGYKKALIRETVGKLVSGLVLGIGYLAAIWDKDKQTWHDKMAKTVVVRV